MSAGEKMCRVDKIRVFGNDAEEQHSVDIGNGPAALQKAAAILKEAFRRNSRIPSCEIVIAVTDPRAPEGEGAHNLSFSVTNGELFVVIPR